MADGRMFTAEQFVDRRVRVEVFRGREIEFATGRVVLHALGDDGQAPCGQALCGQALYGQALCGLAPGGLAPGGHGPAGLTATGRPWDAGYLPHLLRCQGCVAAGAPARPAGTGRASGVDVRTAHGSDREDAAAAALRAVLEAHDLRRWMFTDVVTVDENIGGGYSHPLTIGAKLLEQRPALALTTFLHEQLHWLEGPRTERAAAEASERWPDPPRLPAGGADPPSTWLHVSVCALEYVSLSEVLGACAAADELGQHAGYSWIYGQILSDPGWFAGFLRRHGLRVPARPPVPRRYCGEAWWAS